LDTRGDRAVSLVIGEARARMTGTLRHRLSASADWGGRDSLAARASWGNGEDTAGLVARLSKDNLLHARADLRARIATSRAYARALGLSAALPRAEGVVLEAHVAQDRELSARLRLGLRAEGLPRNLPIALSPEKLALRLNFAGSKGDWSLQGRGDGGEAVDLEGTLAALRTDSLGDPAYLARYMQVTLRGAIRGFKVAAGGKTLPADLDIAEAAFSRAAVRAAVVTGDGSRLEADLRSAEAPKPGAPPRKAGARPKPIAARGKRRGNAPATPPPVPPWNGTFSLELAPHETWITAFTDTNVAFAKARIRGDLEGGAVHAVLEARGLKAYGVMADSLWTEHRYAGGVYSLEPSRLWRAGAAWDLSGRAEPGKAGPPASIRLSHPEFGSVEAAQAGVGKLEAHLRDLAVDRLPYRGLDTLKANRPRLTADFAWDRGAKTGSADVSLEGRYQKEAVAVAARAAWDPERLDVREARAALSGNGIAASARIRLHGKQFYELKGLTPDDVEDATLRADRFDVAKALAALMPQPPLRAATVSGDLGYAPGMGFRGAWRVQNLVLAGEQPAIAFKELSLSGRGDTLGLRVITASDQEPLFRDTVSVSLTGILQANQGLAVRARAGQYIFVAFDGGLAGFKDLQGRLSVRGAAVLPSGSGVLNDVRIAATVALPLKEGIRGLRLEADTLRGTYAVPGLDTQAIAATVRMRGGQIEIPELSIQGRDGALLRGRMRFDPASRKLSADLDGSRLTAQLGGDKIQLRELAVHAQADSTQLIVQAAVGSGSAEHVKSPLRAAGDFSRLTAYYRAPLGPKMAGPQGETLPLIRLSATLDSSEVRYRLRTLESLTGLFRKQGQRKAAGRRAKPMQVQINVETAGRGNSIETDVLRLAYVGNLSMVGTYPYALVRGRINSVSGGIGSKKQAYEIKNMEVKWLNSPIEEGELELNAEKRLARNCDSISSTDSCAIRMNLTGQLSDIKFAYDSDCRGSYGSGSADVTALIYSVRRGCYSPAAASGTGGLTYQEQALGLLEPLASSYLSEAAGKLSGRWIASAQVTGLGALATDRKSSASDTASARDAIALEVLSKEFWRVRLRAKSAYNLQYADQFNPWSYRVGVEWQPPLFRLVEDPTWRNRIKNRITVDAAVFTDPSHSASGQNEDPLRRRIGLNYNYDWWGHWWSKPRPAAPRPAAADSASRKAAGRDDAR
jgi:hypothetical protein